MNIHISHRRLICNIVKDMDLDYLQPLEVPLYDESIEEHLDTLMAYTDDDLLDIIDETVRTEEEELASLSEDLLMVLIKRLFKTIVLIRKHI